MDTVIWVVLAVLLGVAEIFTLMASLGPGFTASFAILEIGSGA